MPVLDYVTIFQPQADTGAVKNIDTDNLQDNVLVFIDGKSAFYHYDADSSATGDDDRVLEPTSGDGRWIKIASEDLANIVDDLATDSSTRPLSAAQGKDLNDRLDATISKIPVHVGTTADLTLSGEQTIDGVTTSESDVLVWQQSDASENGVYTTSSSAWSRRSDMTTGEQIVGSKIWVLQGTLNGQKSFRNINSTEPDVGTDDIDFTYDFSVVEWIKVEDDSAAGDQTSETFIFNAVDKVTVRSIKYLPSASLNSNDTNFATITVYRRDSDGTGQVTVASITTETSGSGGSGDWTAFSAVDLGSLSNQAISPGKGLTVEITKSGSGVVVPRGTLQVEISGN